MDIFQFQASQGYTAVTLFKKKKKKFFHPVISELELSQECPKASLGLVRGTVSKSKMGRDRERHPTSTPGFPKPTNGKYIPHVHRHTHHPQ